jgi:hypothetical protein
MESKHKGSIIKFEFVSTLLTAVFFLISGYTSFGQEASLKIEKNVLDSSDTHYGYYLSIHPKSKDVKGVMVLLPGLGQVAENVFRDSELHQFAYENEILTIAFSTGLTIEEVEKLKVKKL